MSHELSLLSPVGSKPFTYRCYPSKGGDNIINASEIIETIRLVCDELPELRSALDSDLMRSANNSSFLSLKQVTSKYNKELARYLAKKKQSDINQSVKSQASRHLLRHILQQAYNQSITDPEKLNRYTPFTAEVYGETSYDLICQAIDHANITEHDTFIDLGSGVGQVVLQVAALTPCKFSWGIELAEWPCRYAENLDRQFRSLMKWWGKIHGEYRLIRGDFLDLVHSDKLRSSTVIFVNNFAFDAKLELDLKERFTEAAEGTRIISSKAFSPVNFRITNRNLSNIGCIMNVSELPRGSVSWTSNALTYYLHVIDRTKLYKYFEQQKNKEGGKIRGKKECEVAKNSELHIDETENFDSGVAATRNGIKESLDALVESLSNVLMGEIQKFADPAYRETISTAIKEQQELHQRLKKEILLVNRDIARLERENFGIRNSVQLLDSWDSIKESTTRAQEEVISLENLKCLSSRKRPLNNVQFQVCDGADGKLRRLEDRATSASSALEEWITAALEKRVHKSPEAPRTAALRAGVNACSPAVMEKLKLSRHCRQEKLIFPQQLQRIARSFY